MRSRRVGHARATDLILTGRRIDTAEASAWGLVDRVVPAGSALQAALELAGQICRGAPSASLEALHPMRSTETVARGLADERRAGARALLSGEVVEGFTAWSEKRDPAWIP